MRMSFFFCSACQYVGNELAACCMFRRPNDKKNYERAVKAKPKVIKLQG